VSSWRVKLAVTILKCLAAMKVRHFTKALLIPDVAQQDVFNKIIANLSQSTYGKKFHVTPAMHYDVFKKNVPITNYDALIPWIEQQKLGVKKVFMQAPVIFFEKTSGSSGAAKYIPYNKALLSSFNTLFSLWAHDIVSFGPKLATGKVFMSISPAVATEKFTTGKIPVGLNNDSQYLQKIWQWLIKPFLVSPPKCATESIDDYRYLLAVTLVACADLEIISIWNPTYLLSILDTIKMRRETLSFDLRSGHIIHAGTKYFFQKLSPERQQLLAQPTISWPTLWPKLKMISCWDAGSARTSANKLADLFPAIFIQGKGLLATEAPITLPLIKASGGVPMLNDVFFEFIDAEKNILLLHQLALGETYEIIISQHSGLCRYRLGDRVKVVSRHYSTPCLEFVGRIEDTCDLVGEKLNAQFVYEAVSTLLASQAIFFALIPDMDQNGFGRYILFSEPSEVLNDENIDNVLSESYHYQNARVTGQLQKAKVILSPNLEKNMQDFFITKGMRWGNIKNTHFVSDQRVAKELYNYITDLAEPITVSPTEKKTIVSAASQRIAKNDCVFS
jgi:hypothetical protein